MRWVLKSREIIFDSDNKNYLEQTQVLAKYIKEEVFFNQQMPAEFVEALDEFECRHSRYVILGGFNPDFFLSKEEREKNTIKRRSIEKKLQGNIYGTHMLEFNLDPEFGIHLPSSSGKDLMMNLATKFQDREIKKNENIKRTLQKKR